MLLSYSWKWLAVFSLLAIGLSGNLLAQQSSTKVLLPVKEHGRWGYINAAGKWIVPPNLDGAGFGKFGYALAQKGNKVGLLDSAGNTVIPISYQSLKPLNDSLTLYQEDKKWGIIHLRNQHKSPAEWDLLRPFQHTFIALKEERYALINWDGSLILAPEYTAITAMPGKRVLAEHPNGLQVVNESGLLLFPEFADSIVALPGQNLAYRSQRAWNVVHTSGRVVLPVPADSLVSSKGMWVKFCWQDSCSNLSLISGNAVASSPFTSSKIVAIGNGTYLFEFEEKYGLMDADGNILLEASYSSIRKAGDGNFFIRKHQQIGLCSSQGSPLIEVKFDLIYWLEPGIYLTYQNNLQGIYSKTGKELLPTEFLTVSIVNRVAKAYHPNGSIQILEFNANGKPIEKLAFKEVKTLRLSGDRPTQNNGTTATSNNNTTPVVPASERIELNYWFFSSKDQKWGLKNLATREDVIPPSFENIDLDTASKLTLVRQLVKVPSGQDYFLDGLVDHVKGIVLVQPQYLKIHFRNFNRPGQEVVRCVTQNHQIGLLNRKGKLLLQASIIDEFHDGLARVNLGGKPRSSSPRPESIMTSSQYGNLTKKSTYSQNQSVYWLGGKWGFIDQTGNLAIPMKYQYVGNFYKGKAIVKQNKKWGVIDTLNEKVIDLVYEGVKIIGKDSNWFQLEKRSPVVGLIDPAGNFVLAQEYQEIGRYAENRIRVKKNGRWGMLDTEGKEVVPLTFVKIDDFKEGRAPARVRGKWGYLAADGTWAIPPNYQLTGSFKNGIARVRYQGKYGFIDLTGNWVIEPQFLQAEDFFEGVAIVRNSKGSGLINLKGEWTVKPKYLSIELDQEGNHYRAVRNHEVSWIYPDGTRWNQIPMDKLDDFSSGCGVFTFEGMKGLADTNGHELLPPLYDKLVRFSSDEYLFSIEDSTRGYLNSQGQEIPIRSYNMYQHLLKVSETSTGNLELDQQAEHFRSTNVLASSPINEGFSVAKNFGGKFFYLDSLGDPAFEQEFLYASSFRDGLSIVKVASGMGILTSKGIWAVPPTYPHLSRRADGYFEAGTHSLFGLADFDGQLIAEPIYQNLNWVTPEILSLTQSGLLDYLSSNGTWIWRSEL